MKLNTSTQHHGSSLIICLTMISLLVGLLLVFFSKAQNTYLIENSGASRIRGEIFAQSALEYTVGLLTHEVTDPEASQIIEVDGTRVFKPKNPRDMVPKNQFKSELARAKQTHMPSILKQSIRAMDPKASDVMTKSPNKQGRYVYGTRWNEPWFYYATHQFGTGSECPNWIYFDDNGATPRITPNIQGRAAFNIYHLDSLIDFSVAGYPASMTGHAEKVSSLKGSLAGADITQLGWVYDDPTNNQVDVRSRRSVRNGTYLDKVLLNRNGFLEPDDGNTQFVSRLDLLRFSKSNGLNFNPLAFMTAWSRTVEAPCWDPETPAPENVFAPAILRQKEVKITNHYPDGSFMTRSAKVKEPVASRRFPLSRVSWFNLTDSTRPNKAAVIQQYFGLKKAAGIWLYEDTHIKRLSELKTADRDPNFFEMLKASIETGSLGTVFNSGDGLLTAARDADKDLQILRIGACIIDAATTGNAPTVISFTNAQGVTRRVCGVKDLPYIHSLRFRQIAQTDATGQVERVDQFALPILVNPHSLSIQNDVRPPVRLRMIGHVTQPVATVAGQTGGLSSRIYSGLKPDAPARILPINPNAFRVIGPVMKSQLQDVDSDISVLMPGYFTGECLGFWLATGTSGAKTNTTVSKGSANLVGFNLVLEYWNEEAGWVIYDTLAGDGYDVGNLGFGASMITEFAGTTGVQKTPNDTALKGAQTPYLLKPDPRTTRWGIVRGKTAAALNVVPTEALISYAAVTGFTPSDQFPDVADRDGKVRLNDLKIGSQLTSNKDKKMKHVLGDIHSDVKTKEVSEDRNVILHRPFHTVGELGCVFRDQPWKTLNFATADSADGALLDYFTINEVGPEGVVAGRFNLNVQTPPDALIVQLRGSSCMLTKTTDSVLKAHAESISIPFLKQTGSTPFTSPAQLVGALPFARLPTNMKASKQRQETLVRSLGTSGQTRTWNFFIDLIAQVGRITPRDSSDWERDFIAEGETRLWMHVAIDRFTGKVVSSHTEVFQE